MGRVDRLDFGRHVDIADSIGLMGGIYYEQGKYYEAEVFYKRALST